MAHRYRMYPTAEQNNIMLMHCGHSRFVWNLALAQCNLARQFNQYANQTDWDKQLTEARGEFEWLSKGSSSVQQTALRDLRQAFRNWWCNPSHFGFPSFRKKSGQQGFAVRDLTVRFINRRWAVITIPKAGQVKFRLSRPIPKEAKSARVTLDRSGRWHVSLVSPQPEFVRESTDKQAGIDVGIVHTITTSDGNHFDMPELASAQEYRRMKLLQRRMSRQKKGSQRRERTRKALARLKSRETDRRKDWIEKITTSLVRQYNFIVIEDLSVKNMTRSAKGSIEQPGQNVQLKALFNKMILNQAWSTTRRRLNDKVNASTTPSVLVAVSPKNTSRRCSVCDYTTPENRENQAVFECRSCGHKDNADINAAKNILAAGQAVTGRGGLGYQAVEPSTTKGIVTCLTT